MGGRLSTIGRDTLAGSAEVVAPDLLGARLVAQSAAGAVVARIVEVEAYMGADDPASHAYRGRTARTAVMFGPAGHAYVYFTYGMHHCLNVSCGPEGSASAVLFRAAEVLDGLTTVRDRRGTAPFRDLARGPARLCVALGVDLSFNGIDLCDPTAALRLEPGTPPEPAELASGPRVGVSRAADRPWRWWIRDEPTVSAYRAGGRAGRSTKALDR